MDKNKNKPLLFYCGHHKCGTSWIRAIIKTVCAFLGLEYFNATEPGYYNHDLKAFTETNHFEFFALPNSIFPHIESVEDKRAFHVIRDPRDVCVSAYYSHLYTHTSKDFKRMPEIRKHLQSSSKDEGLLSVIKGRKGQFVLMYEWDYSCPDILELKFETLIQKDSYDHFLRIFRFLGLSGEGEGQLPGEKLAAILERNSFKRISGGREPGEENIRNHFRKGIAGDWKNHFKQEHIDYFKEHHNPLLIKLGYEKDENWGI